MKILKKIVSLILVLTLLSTLLLTGCGNKKDNGEYVFKIGTANGSLCLAPLHIAADNGYFEEEFKAAGIKYELVEIDIQQTADLVASKKNRCLRWAGRKLYTSSR